MSKILHWLVAGLIVLQFILANLAERAEDAGLDLQQLALLANHKSVGISIFMLALLRLAWRKLAPPPELPASMPHWQMLAARISHYLLYTLIILMPISGWLMSSASAYPVSWFKLLQLPDLVAPDAALKESFRVIHQLLGKLLVILASVHILAALKHHFIDKDAVLRRMTSPISMTLFLVVIAAGAATLGRVGNPGAVEKSPAVDEAETVIETPPTVAEPLEEPVPEPVVVRADLPGWQIDHSDSYIHFTASQAGAEFDGAWPNWSAQLRFAGDRLLDSSFDVSIRTAEVSTGDADRDAALADPEWFDAANFPEAYYRASRFTQLEDGSFTADGELFIKGVATPVLFRFSVETNGDDRVLTGSAELLRLELGLGTGEWADTEWVGNEVRVNVRVHASVSGL
ncbi:MAG: cytochrome b/b6 domain-containing protein [Gammaproteobacteria bacterium]|nr:cytochrome b/b6 domain-containing protein [Gammaproteobacteria bacterium]MDH5304289.1 cytochrome b/b6 domain-containing protein [Gammaproteobacteria bacterium]MDH5321555.1 cytochrome b/b6 domain-containing protein [Gammaproteobacteria bacterium]